MWPGLGIEALLFPKREFSGEGIRRTSVFNGNWEAQEDVDDPATYNLFRGQDAVRADVASGYVGVEGERDAQITLRSTRHHG